MIKNPHLVKFFSSNCLSDLAPFFQNYYNAKKRDKEISESMGCLEALFKYKSREYIDDSIIYVVGDGVYPRTGAIISHFTRAKCVSIDPVMYVDKVEIYRKYKEALGKPLKNLEVQNSMIQDYEFKKSNRSNCIFVMPHSHAPFIETVKLANKQGLKPEVLNLPCCKKVPNEFLMKKKPKTFRDWDMMTPKNEFQYFEALEL